MSSRFTALVNNDTIYKVKNKYIGHSTAWLNGKRGKLTGKLNFRKVHTKTKSCFQLFEIISTAIQYIDTKTHTCIHRDKHASCCVQIYRIRVDGKRDNYAILVKD